MDAIVTNVVDSMVFRFILSGLVNDGMITSEVAEETLKRLSRGGAKEDDNAA